MITVRFASGFSVRYNDATCINPGTTSTDLYKKKVNGKHEGWVARVPLDCLIEATPPCATYDAAKPSEDLKAEVASLRKEIRVLTRKVGKS